MHIREHLFVCAQATVPDEEWLIEGDDEDDCPGAVDWLIGSGSEGDTDFVKPSHLPDDVPEVPFVLLYFGQVHLMSVQRRPVLSLCSFFLAPG